jgi:hypothetical protein
MNMGLRQILLMLLQLAVTAVIVMLFLMVLTRGQIIHGELL